MVVQQCPPRAAASHAQEKGTVHAEGEGVAKKKVASGQQTMQDETSGVAARDVCEHRHPGGEQRCEVLPRRAAGRPQ